MVNQGDTMYKKYLVTPKGVDKDTESQPNKSWKNKSKKTRRVTKTCRVRIQDDTVDIKLASSHEEYIVTLASFDSE